MSLRKPLKCHLGTDDNGNTDPRYIIYSKKEVSTIRRRNSLLFEEGILYSTIRFGSKKEVSTLLKEVLFYYAKEVSIIRRRNRILIGYGALYMGNGSV
jgi:hypothetical protein